MTTKDDVRDSVSKAYARAATAPRSCCSDTEGSGLADYDAEALRDLPEDAVSYSFGCGDPLAFAEVAPGDTVLDLGSGAGIDLLLAARGVGPTGRVIGVDMTDEMVDKARANIAAAGLDNVEVRKGYIEDLPVESGSVDWVISNCVINLSPDKDRVFAEIARVLKPGGRLRVSDIVVEHLPDWLRQVEAVYNGCVGGAISESEYVAGLEKAGLTDIDVTKRHVYETKVLESLVSEGLHGADGGSCCGVGPHGEVDADRVAEAMAGNVWSARFHACKQGSPHS
jgi:SAM-dependent methyltransferase